MRIICALFGHIFRHSSTASGRRMSVCRYCGLTRSGWR